LHAVQAYTYTSDPATGPLSACSHLLLFLLIRPKHSSQYLDLSNSTVAKKVSELVDLISLFDKLTAITFIPDMLMPPLFG
jgi:hypothetical protein